METNNPPVSVSVLLCCGRAGAELELDQGGDCMMRTETRADCGSRHAISNKTISPISHATTLSYSQLELDWRLEQWEH